MAIDIVLLPPVDIMDMAIAINQKEAERGNDRGPLAKNDFYPHISLAMGTVKDEDLKVIIDMVAKISEKQGPLKIELTELAFVVKSDGSKSYAMRARRTKEIQELHEELMNNLLPYSSLDATLDEIYWKKDEEVALPKVVNTYHEKSSFENFDPHLTLRCKEVAFDAFPIVFSASNLAICQIGTETTCRKILYQKTLR